MLDGVPYKGHPVGMRSGVLVRLKDIFGELGVHQGMDAETCLERASKTYII